ncbi:MAG: sulfotransferase, partial [Rickettsiales bacterium]|nr:sulfotransferase [Rickettsiales bacterium]
FILLGAPRTGSSMLEMLLQQHPGITMYKELFHPELPQRSNVHFFKNHEGKKTFYDGTGSPLDFLKENVWNHALHPEGQAVGFKLFYHHCRTPEEQGLWQSLADMPELRVIHLVRNNPFHSLVSLKVAQKTNQWILVGGNQQKEFEPLSIDVTTCEKFFDEFTQQRKKAEQLFAKKDTITVDYDAELAARPIATAQELFRFLGLPEFTPKLVTMKQVKKPYTSIISNYHILKQYFADSPYAGYFTERTGT